MNEGSRWAARRRTRRGMVVLGGICASLWLGMPAHAEAPTQDAARRLFEEARGEIARRDWAKAWELLSAAYRLDPRPEYAVNLGMVELRLERTRDAAEHLSIFLREAQGISAGDRERAEKKLAEAGAKLARVTLEVTPVGAEVRVDGRYLGTSPLSRPVWVEPGMRKFEARTEGFPPELREIEVKAGTSPVVTIQEPKAAPETAPVLPPRPVETDERSAAVIGTGIAVGSARFAVGVGTAIGSFVAASTRDQHAYGARDDYMKFEERRVDLANTAFYSILGAGLIGTATAVYAFTGSKPAKGSAPRASFVVCPAGGNVFVMGSF